jgi:hypothetical protein
MAQATKPRPADAFASKNPYRLRSYKSKNIRSLSDALLLVPSPTVPEHPIWEEMYWRAWGVAWSNLRRPNPTSGMIANFPSSVQDKHLHMWESALTTQFGIYGQRAFDFLGALDNFYAKQHGDGFICREINSESGFDLFHPFDPNSTGPNILAWVEWRAYRQSGEKNRLIDVFWPLMALHRWMRSNRSWPNGLYWSTGLSGGMTNQSRVPGGRHHHRHWSWVDASMQAALNTRILAKMAVTIGEGEIAESLQNEHLDLIQEINASLWNDADSFYHDIDSKGRFSPVKSAGAYWSLLDREIVTPKRLDPFINHFRNPRTFNRLHRIPTLAADSVDYSPDGGDYWRGGIWSPINFMILKGLRTVGKSRLAHEIAVNHLDHLAEVFQHTDTFWEYYSPEGAVPGPGAKPHFIGWTGLSAISILIEDAIGIQVDWPQRQVTWDRYLDCSKTYGVRNYPLGPDGTLTLLGDQEKIQIESTSSFMLVINAPDRQLRTPIPAGTTEIPWESGS